jgi:RNA polymerase sigma factor (sigma-70 family)
MVTAEDTGTLLREFVRTRSDAAFGELVRQHLDLVYSTALRRCGGDAALAKDIAQTVFADLARKAGSLPLDVVLPGWLYRHTTFVASSLLRSELRRRQREKTAMEIRELDGNEKTDWAAVSPLLDDAIQELPARYRDALVLRFFDQQPFARVGAMLGISEDAARMRVERGLTRLRGLLSQRGVHSTVAALALTLGHCGAIAAPAGLAAAVTSTALAGTAATAALTSSTATLGIVEFMASTKLKIGLASLVAVTAAGTAVVEHRANRALREQVVAAQSEAAAAHAAAASAQGFTQPPGEFSLSDQQRIELMELRNKAARLREAEEALARVQEENRQLREALQQSVSAANRLQSPPEAVSPEVLGEVEMTKGLGMARLNFVRNWAIALILYADQHGDVLPQSLSEAAEFYPAENDSGTEVLDPQRFEIVYRGALKDITDPARTILIREKEAYRGRTDPNAPPKYMRAYAFADGHSEIHSGPTDDFSAWEQERIIQPAR